MPLDSISVVTAADERYAIPQAVMVASALSRLRADRSVELHVLDAGLSQRSIRRLERLAKDKHPRASLRLLRPDLTLFDGFKTWPRLPKAAYSRILTPQLLGEAYDRAIYLDPDVVVLADLARLWEVPIDDHPVAAVQDFTVPFTGSKGGLPHGPGKPVSGTEPYFNSGVMLMNLAWWRREQATGKLLDYLREQGDQIRFVDQDALNAVFCGQWKRLDPRWNRAPQFRRWRSWQDHALRREVEELGEELSERPYVVHFVGRDKPWSLRSRSLDRGLFYQELRASGVLRGISYPAWRYGSRVGRELLLHGARLRGYAAGKLAGTAKNGAPSAP